MQAVLIRNFGGPEVLEKAQIPDPVPASGEVLVRVRACALNHLDFWVRQGIPAYKIALPHILGCDVAGEIAAVGPGVEGWLAGQKVAVAPGRSCRRCEFCLDGKDNYCARYGIIGAQAGPGGYAELLSVPEECLLPMREGVSFEDAAAFPLTFLTAWHMLVNLGALKAGQTALVMGAGSGVGVAAIQVAKLCGANVIAASTSADKLAKAKGLGADHGIHSPPEDVMRQVVKLTSRGMVDLVFEHVGPAVFDAALKCLRPGGKLVTCGSTSGSEVSVDMRYVFSRQLQILGAKMGSLADMRRVWGLLNEGRLKPVVDKVFPLAEARAAHEYLAERRQFGKVLLKV